MRKPGSIAFAMVYGAIIAHVYTRYPLTAQTKLMCAALPLTSIVILLVSFRAISVNEAVHHRLTHNLKDYEAKLRRKIILSNNGFGLIIKMLLYLNALTLAPLAWSLYSQTALASRISTPLVFLFGGGSLLVSAFSILMSLTQPLMQVTFEEAKDKDDGFPQEIPDALVPIKVLAPYLTRHAGVDGWHRVARTSRKHDVHARVDKDAGLYEIRTQWSEDHPSTGSPTAGPGLGPSAQTGRAASTGLQGRLSDL